jgi:hypothetical protein
MKATDIIRNILDIIDGIDNHEEPSAEIVATTPADDINHFKQIVDVLSNNNPVEFANSPNEQYSDVNAVTIDAGGGINGPKNPHDIRVKDPSAYPEYNSQEFENPANNKQIQHKSFIEYLNDRGI